MLTHDFHLMRLLVDDRRAMLERDAARWRLVHHSRRTRRPTTPWWRRLIGTSGRARVVALQQSAAAPCDVDDAA